jgi:O-antigen/teichoic acid export membrane protein
MASRVRVVTNLLFLAVILLFWSWLAPVFKIGPYRSEFLLFCVIVLLHFQAGVLQLSLSSHMLHRYSIGMTVLLSSAKLIAYAVLSARGELTLVTAIVADCVAYGLMFAGLRIAHGRHCRSKAAPDSQPLVVPASERRRLVRYGMFNNFNDAGTLLLSSHSDNFFVAAMMTPVAVGAYAFYVRINDMAEQLLPIRQFSSVMLPMLFSVKGEEAGDRLPRYFTFMVNATLCVHLPILAFFVAYHRELVEFVFAGKFIADSGLLPLITALAVVGAISESATLLAQYHEKAGIILLSKVFAFGNILGMLVLVPLAGVYGAAISTGTSVILKNAFIWWHVRDVARWRNYRAVLAAAVLVWGSYVLVCAGLKQVMPHIPLLQLAVGALLAAPWSLIYARSAALSASDRDLVGRLVSGRASRIVQSLGIVPRASGA